ncbi:MAG: SRPBCC family protein [Acetobacteraceae bacterium]|nr:SRPBCC family protein [Acetobacteraceae bacterium]
MAGSIMAVQRNGSSRRGRPSSDASAGGRMQGLGWIPIALGTAAIVAGLGSRKKGTMALALTAFAGVAAAAAVRDGQLGRGKADSKGQGGASGGEPEVERSITIGKTADELRHCWLDPRTLPQIMAGFATVRASGDGRMHWKIEGPLDRAYEWDAETVDDQPGEGIGWRSLPGAGVPNEGSVRFRPATGGRGTVATLRLRFDPPGGALGAAAVKLLGTTPLGLAADQALHRFKSLVETGEIPTTERQPAVRADTR